MLGRPRQSTRRPRPLSTTVPMPYHLCAQLSNDVRRVRCASWRVFGRSSFGPSRTRALFWRNRPHCPYAEIGIDATETESLRGLEGDALGFCIGCAHTTGSWTLLKSTDLSHQAIWQEKAEKAARSLDGASSTALHCNKKPRASQRPSSQRYVVAAIRRRTTKKS